jgi:urease accessory protein
MTAHGLDSPEGELAGIDVADHGSSTGAGAVRANTEPQAVLRFTQSPDGQSYIARQRVGYPYHITRPFYLDTEPAGALTLYLQSVSGGIYQGEDLRMSCVADPGCAAHVTTQAATIVHRMPAEEASQTTTLDAADGALLEYLPDPLIMFPGARLTSVLDITAHPGATVVASESFAHHDPGGEDKRFDTLLAEMRIRDPAGTLLAFERYAVTGAQLAEGGGQTAAWPAQGSFVVLHRGPECEAIAASLREAVAGLESTYGGVSTLPNDCGLVVRLLATDGTALRRGLQVAWEAVRLGLYGVLPGVRRK